ncbi:MULTISPECIES: hypothetical protein [unclassified Pseudoalteromonas]|uniref:hypothetical protein n=1 Tax=unclassified Pseudoalteromonas TaxID=194690 RepID=UPI0005A716C3
MDTSFSDKAQPWIDKISKQEMPALASTVRELENVAKDDTASLAKLGQAVLHDHALTSKLLSSLLKNKNLTPIVYNRLINLMTQSFHAGMIAKMMVSKHDIEIQEQTFIAVLLNKLCESKFWSMGGEVTDNLDHQTIRNENTVGI